MYKVFKKLPVFMPAWLLTFFFYLILYSLIQEVEKILVFKVGDGPRQEAQDLYVK
jgi:hypothetical protein